MEIKIYNKLPKESLDIRLEVFVDEQGFDDREGDEDASATHLVAYDGEEAIGTLRILKTDDEGVYLFGRLAVLKERRGEGIGKALVIRGEEHVRSLGAEAVIIQAQEHAVPFYERLGYTADGEAALEQGRIHLPMKKSFMPI